MPPPQEIIREAMRILAGVRLDQFVVEPARVVPLQPATLSWRVRFESGAAGLRLRVGTLVWSVQSTGSRSVSPLRTTTYVLEAVASRGISRVLGSQTVEVDSTGCLIDLPMPEDEVRERVKAEIDGILLERPELTRRASDAVEVDTAGIDVRLRFRARLDDLPDPDVDVDALVKLRVEDGRLAHTIVRYRFDVDFPWWFDLASGAFLPAWLAIALREGSDERETRGRIDRAFKRILNDRTTQARAGGFRIVAIRTTRDAVLYSVCPERS